jgi:hypothetical protein
MAASACDFCLVEVARPVLASRDGLFPSGLQQAFFMAGVLQWAMSLQHSIAISSSPAQREAVSGENTSEKPIVHAVRGRARPIEPFIDPF